MKKLAYFLLLFLFITDIYSQPMNGIYSIGTGSNFTTIANALNSALQNGLGGPVILELSSSYNSSLETYPLTVQNYQGISSLNTLTLRPAPGTDSVIISASGASIFLLDGCSYFIIDGRPGGTGNFKGIKLIASGNYPLINFLDDASNNFVRFIQLEGNYVEQSLINFPSGIFTGSNHNKIQSCTFKNIDGGAFPGTAISFHGGYIIKNTGNEVEDCDILNFNKIGIYVSGLSDSTTIKNCRFYQTSPASGFALSAIKIDNATNTIINGNKITGFASVSSGYSELNGILIEDLYDFSLGTVIISNNFISLGPASEGNGADISGIKYNGKRGYSVEAYYNTILISGSDDYGSFSYCINKSDSASVFNVRNNILINKRVTYSCPGKQFCIYVPVTMGFQSDYNTFHNGYNTPTVGHWSGTDLYTFEDWQNISLKDSNSNFAPVKFISPYDLHLTDSSLGDMNLAASPVQNIIYDIDGELRDSFLPYKGADENTAFPLPVELVYFNCTVTDNQVFLSWQTASEVNNLGFAVERNTDGIWKTLTFIPGKINSTEKNFYSFTDSPVQGTFHYRLKQVDLNGVFSYSNEVTAVINNRIDFSLAQNYPNPFNPFTSISFSIPEKNQISLKVYDIRGQLIKTLINDVLDSGSYNINFVSDDIPSGIYFYELCSGSKKIVNKMCLIK